MNQDFTGKSHIEILAAIVKNISDREEQEIANYVNARLVRLENYKGSQPIIELSQSGAAPAEICAMLVSNQHSQLARFLESTGLLNELDSAGRAACLAAMLPSKPTAEITPGR